MGRRQQAKQQRARDRLFAEAVYASLRRIDTERLVIRWATPIDAGAYLRTIDDDVVTTNGWPRGERQQRRNYTKTRAFCIEPLITHRETCEVLGAISPSRLDGENRVCELGWWLASRHRRQGYGTEALAAVVAALHTAGVRWVVLGTATTNTAVVRVMEKLGGRRFRDEPHQLPNGTVVESAWYSFESEAGPAAQVR